MALITPRRERWIRSAEKLVANGRLKAAIAEYRKVLDKEPGDTNTLNRVGDLYARLNQTDEAVGLYRRIAEHYTEDGFVVKAIAIYKKILRLDPSQLDVYDALAGLYRQKGLISEARAQYRVLAEDQRSRGDLEGAQELHRRMLEFEPGRLGNMAVLVELQEQRGQLDLALNGYRFMMLRMLDHGDGDGADRVFRKALEVCSDEIDFVIETVGQLRGGGHGEMADTLLAEALVRHPEVERMVSLVGRPATVKKAPSKTSTTPAVGKAEKPVKKAAKARRSAKPAKKSSRPVVGAKKTDSGDLEFELDLQDLERHVEAPVGPGEPPVADPLQEVDIFLKYGLHEKAAECLRNILAADPDHEGALSRAVGLSLSEGNYEQAVPPARRLAALGEEGDDSHAWSGVRESLLAAGFRVDGVEVEMPLAEDRDAGRRAHVAKAAPETEVSDVGWLDDLKQAPEGDAPVELFESEEEFFDLAAELEDELNQDIDVAGEPPSELGAAPTLDRIVESFRQKLDESLSPADYDTHYNLGIAYREMGLLDEAVSEFQLAAKDSRYLVDCCSLLGASFLEKGFPDVAVKWYRRGAESSMASDSERLGLQYELVVLFESIGDDEGARDSLASILAVDPGYRDAAARLDELGPPTEG